MHESNAKVSLDRSLEYFEEDARFFFFFFLQNLVQNTSAAAV